MTQPQGQPPYQPPHPPPQQWPVPYPPLPGPGPLPRPPNVLVGFLIAGIVAWCGAAMLVAQGAVLVGAQPGTPAGGVMFLLGGAAALLALAATGTMTIVWQVRARAVALRLGGPVPDSWTVAAWVIPLANLVVPPWLVHAVLRSGAGPRTAAGDGLLVAGWWGTWLLAWGATWFAMSFGSGAERSTSPFGPLNWLAAGLWIACGALFAAIVLRVRSRQLAAAA